ncbi:MAG: YgjV family protein, partial [Hyphomicrobiales bacterium]|nr:YgjV family protein [Hyphomicrobiales bacterium]
FFICAAATKDSPMSWIDFVGYLAALMVLATFCMDTIVPLRGLAIASNLLFILYGIAGQLYPVLLLHAVLLPVNIVKIVRLRPQARRVDGKHTSARRQRHGAR